MRNEIREAPVKCCTCGKFIADRDLEFARLQHIPDSEFGPEENNWTCKECILKDWESA